MPLRGNSVLPHRPPAQHKPDGPSHTQTKPHVAPQRQSAGEVARAHGVKKAAILDANPRLRHIPFLAQGDRVEIPQDRESKSRQYEVKQGDTPKSVAERHGVSEEALRDENGLESFDRIQPGEVLNIPDAEDAPTRGSSRDNRENYTARTSWRPDAEPAADPVTSAQQRTDEAAARAAEAELPPPGVMSGLSPSVQRVMIAESNAAQQELDAAVEAEITARANAPGQPPLTYDTLYNTAALAVESRVRGTATEKVVGEAVDRLNAARAAEQAKTPLDRAEERTDEAAQSVSDAEQELAKLENSGIPAANIQDEIDAARADLASAQRELDAAVKAEIEVHANDLSYLPESSDVLYGMAIDAVKSRLADSPQAAHINESADRARVDRTLDVAAQQDPETALQRVDQLLASLPPDMQDSVLADARVESVLTSAAEKAGEPLEGDLDAYTATDSVYESLDTVAAMTEGLDPRLTSRLVDKSITNLERVFAENGIDAVDIPHREGAMGIMTTLAGRAFEDTQDMALVDRAIDVLGGSDNWQMPASIRAISEDGAPPVLALRVGELHGTSEATVEEVSFAVQYFADTSLSGAYQDFIEANEALSWRIVSLGPLASEDELQKAVNDYISEHPELAATQAELAERGEQLTIQLRQLNALGGDLATNSVAGENIAKLLGNDSVQTAILAASDANPALLAGEDGLQFLDMVKSVTDIWNNEGDVVMEPFLAKLAERHIVSSYNQQVGMLDPRDPASYAQARQALVDLNDPRLASALGISQDDLDKLLTKFDDIVQEGRKPKRVRQDLNRFVRDEIGDLRNTLPEASRDVVDRLGMGFAVTGLLLGARDFANDPSVLNAINATLGLGDVLNAQTMVNGKYGSLFRSPTFGAVLGAAQTVVGFIDAGTRLKNGDEVGALLAATGAVGSGMLAASAYWASAASLGPIGLGLVAFSVIALAGYDHWQHVSDSNKYMDSTSKKFLEDIGFTSEAAGILFDQSGEGYNILPLLAEYGENKGWTAQETKQWINNMSKDDLTNLRNILNHSMDEVNGNVAEIAESSAPDDSFWLNEGNAERVYNTYDLVDVLSRGIAPPTSFAEIEYLIDNMLGDLPAP
jgi:hypothetical protein